MITLTVLGIAALAAVAYYLGVVIIQPIIQKHLTKFSKDNAEFFSVIITLFSALLIGTITADIISWLR